MAKALYESIRDRQAAIIAQNPASIVITRKTRALETLGAGGLTETTTVLAAQTFRLYFKQEASIIVGEQGYNKQRAVKMTGEYNANVLPKTPNNLDSFSLDGKTYEITDVIPVKAQNQTVYIEVFLEGKNG